MGSNLKQIDNFDKGKIKEITPDDQAAEKVIEGILNKFGRLKTSSFIVNIRIMSVNPIFVEAVRVISVNIK